MRNKSVYSVHPFESHPSFDGDFWWCPTFTVCNYMKKKMWCIYKMEHAEKGYVDTYVKYGRHLMAFDEHATCHAMWKKSPDLSQKQILIQNHGEETCDRYHAMWEKGESVQIFCSRQFFPKDQSQNVFKNVVNCVNLQIFSQPPIFPLRIDHKMCLKM